MSTTHSLKVSEEKRRKTSTSENEILRNRLNVMTAELLRTRAANVALKRSLRDARAQLARKDESIGTEKDKGKAGEGDAERAAKEEEASIYSSITTDEDTEGEEVVRGQVIETLQEQQALVGF